MSLVYQGNNVVAGGRRPNLYIGGKSDAKDQNKLQRCGIHHILNITPTREASIQAGVLNYYESLGQYVYKRIPIYDSTSSATDLLQSADEIVDFIATGLCRGSVLVHCNHGVSRSPTAVCFFLMRREGKSLNESIELIKRRRPQIEPIPAFMDILRTYEQRCITLGIIGITTNASSNKPKRPIGALGPSLPSTESHTHVLEKRPRSTSQLTIGPELPSSSKPNAARDEVSLLTDEVTDYQSVQDATPASRSNPNESTLKAQIQPSLTESGALNGTSESA